MPALNGLLTVMYLLAFFCSCIHCPNDSAFYDVQEYCHTCLDILPLPKYIVSYGPVNVFPVIKSHSSNKLWCGLAGEFDGSAASEGCQCSSYYYHLAPRIGHTFPPPICLPGGHRDHLLYLPLITRLKHCVPGTGLPGLKLTSHVWCRSLKKASYTSHPLCR